MSFKTYVAYTSPVDGTSVSGVGDTAVVGDALVSICAGFTSEMDESVYSFKNSTIKSSSLLLRFVESLQYLSKFGLNFRS